MTNCFLCNTPTNDVRNYDRIVNLNPIPMCKKCQGFISKSVIDKRETK